MFVLVWLLGLTSAWAQDTGASPEDDVAEALPVVGMPPEDPAAAPAEEAVPAEDVEAEVAPATEASGAAPLPAQLPPEVADKAKDKRKPKASTFFSEDLEVRYWQSPERLPAFPDRPVLDYVEAVNRFTGNVFVGPWSVYGQLDAVALFGNRYFVDDVEKAERELLAPGTWSLLVPGAYDPITHGFDGWNRVSRNTYVTLEKLRLQYEKGNVSFIVGDTYAAFGRGIVLNLNRNVDIDIDTSIQGLKLLWRPGAWDVELLFGQANRQQVFQDNPNLGIFGDRRHTIGGLRLARYGLGPANLGAHAVMYDFVEDEGWEAGFEELTTGPDVVAVGGLVELLSVGPTDWYVEADGFFFPDDAVFAGEEKKPGYAIYASGTMYGGPTTWTVEFKRYLNAQRINGLLAPELYQAAIAPTLEYERAITEDSSAAVNSNDVWGGYVRMDWTAIPGELVPFWSLAVFRDLEQGPLHFNQVPETIFHPLVGLEYTKDAWSVFFNLGYRYDRRDDPADGADQQLHGDLLTKIPVAKGWAIDISGGAEWYRWGRNPVQQSDYVEAETSVSLTYKSLVTFTWYTDYSSNPLIDSVGNLSPTVYGAGELQVKPIPNLTMRLFYGAYKSGIRCSGGQCRVLPGFQGGRFALTTSF